MLAIFTIAMATPVPLVQVPVSKGEKKWLWLPQVLTYASRELSSLISPLRPNVAYLQRETFCFMMSHKSRICLV